MAVKSTDIPQARELLISSLGELKCLDLNCLGTVEKDIEKALSLMTRIVLKKRVGRHNKVTAAMRAEIADICIREPDLTDTEIAESIIGHASAAGRVSEIRRGM